jgi:hypothetical protein
MQRRGITETHDSAFSTRGVMRPGVGSEITPRFKLILSLWGWRRYRLCPWLTWSLKPDSRRFTVAWKGNGRCYARTLAFGVEN